MDIAVILTLSVTWLRYCASLLLPIYLATSGLLFRNKYVSIIVFVY